MRITKRVQEYIKNKVSEKFADYDRAEREAYEASKHDVEVWGKAQEERLNEEFHLRYPNVEISRYSAPFHFNEYGFEVPEYSAYREASIRKKDLINSAFEDICLRMELGGTKEELDAMLGELGAKEAGEDA